MSTDAIPEKTGRKTYTKAQKLIFIKEYEESKLSIDDFTKQKGEPSAASLRKWVDEYKKEPQEVSNLKQKVVELELKINELEKENAVFKTQVEMYEKFRHKTD
jgi:transposase-like protein